MPSAPEDLLRHNLGVSEAADAVRRAAEYRASIVWSCIDPTEQAPLWWVKGYETLEQAIQEHWRDHL